MKKLITLILASGLIAIGCDSGSGRVSDATITPQDTVSGNYGEYVANSEVVNVKTLHLALQENGGFEGRVIGEITEVCKSKGCWMMMKLPNGEDMRVTFKDYSFFVPTNSAGFQAIIEGKASRTVTDVATLRHYAEDAGKLPEEVEKITSPKTEYTFEAEGVLIKSHMAS
jgi:hypothetical protein